MYKLYTDKKEIFECKIKLEGASVKNAKARVILETEDLNLIYNGKIESDGTCKIPIKKLRSILPENTNGLMKLEVIADDTFFEPWESAFNVVTSKKVQVEVKEQVDEEKTIIVSEVKVKKEEPKLDEEILSDSTPKQIDAMRTKRAKVQEAQIETMVEFLNKKNITAKTITEHKDDIMPIINKYVEKAKIKNKNRFLKEILKRL